MADTYNLIKKQKGEQFARTLRDHHSGLLEIEGISDIVRYAGSDASVLLPYLMGLLASNEEDVASSSAPEDPFVLLDRAGYNALYADTLEKQNSIASHFKEGELLCTFNDRARYQEYYIIHAVKKNVDDIRREDFRGQEQRQDDYGTSVISIQMLKRGGFIKITNRYNHGVPHGDNTFDSNPDKIIKGLSQALQTHFGVVFSAADVTLPEGFTLINRQLFKYHTERNNIYYGDQAWATNGVIHAVDRSAGDALFEEFLFDNKTKTLKQIDPSSRGSFADDFNRDYGGNRGLYVRDGNLMLGDEVLIGARQSQIITLNLHALTSMGDYCLYDALSLTSFSAPALTYMGDYCLCKASNLKSFFAPVLTSMGEYCLFNASSLKSFSAPDLTRMGNGCLRKANSLSSFSAPALTRMGDDCLQNARSLTSFSAPALTSMGDCCLRDASSLKSFSATPILTNMGHSCLSNANDLKSFSAPALKNIPEHLLRFTSGSAPVNPQPQPRAFSL